MGMFAMVAEVFSPGGVPEVPMPVEVIEDEVIVSVKEADKGKALAQIFKLMRDKRDADLEPHVDKRQELLDAVMDEKKIIEKAENYSVARAMQEQGDAFDRDELLRLRTAADVAAQVIQVKKQEIKKVTAEIDRIQVAFNKSDSYLQQVCEEVANARRAAIVAIGQQGMHQWRLNSERMVRELRMIQRAGELLEKHCDDPELAQRALDELVSISIPSDARALYWSALSPRQQNDNPELNPTKESTEGGDE
jgi:chorismate mutase